MEANRIIVEIEGCRLVADSAIGPGLCSRCEMPRRGKTCVWSMVCSNVTNGAIFRRARDTGGDQATKRRDTVGDQATELLDTVADTVADAMAEIYNGGYAGD